MSLRFTILGCGTSGGTPRIGGAWGACDPNNPRNRRSRASLLVQRQGPQGKTTILVDTSPDCRSQLLEAGVGWIDGVLYTHDHADHCHGIDDLRIVAFNGRRKVAIYHDAETGRRLRERFAYCFEALPGSEYPPILESHEIKAGETFRVDGAGGPVAVLPFRQLHGSGETLGFRFGNGAYSPDVSGIPEDSIAALKGLDVWIVDALRYTPHPSHFSLEEALGWIRRVGARRAVLTHMHVDLDYESLRRQLPDGVEPAYDGMVLDVPEGSVTATAR